MYEILFPPERMDVDGGYLIRDATILAEGTWNGIKYTAAEIAKGASKWRDNTVWNRHFDDEQRDETNRIGLLKNQHFDDHRIAADVFLSNETVEGREMIGLVRTNKINGISVEHVSVEIGNVATQISFLGAAIVPEPACKVCQLSKKELSMEQDEFDKLSATVTELGKSVEKLSNDEIQNTVSNLADKVKELGKMDLDRVKELEARIKELEDTPQGNTAVETDLVDVSAGLIFDKQGVSRRM